MCTNISPMGVGSYHFIDRWRVDAPIDAVWPVVRDVSTYPRWWKDFVEAWRLNDIEGTGSVVRAHVKAALPYHLYWEAEVLREEPPVFLAARMRGDLIGEITWALQPMERGTGLTFEQTVVTGKRFLTVLTPLLKPLFMLNHRVAMRNGEQGLRRLFGKQRR